MSVTTVGVRELRARLSAYLQQVKAGATVIITEHGQPIGRIVPLAGSPEKRMQALVEAGLVTWSGRRLPPLAPIVRPRGEQSVAEILLEGRE